jgi:hypothetical protein
MTFPSIYIVIISITIILRPFIIIILQNTDAMAIGCPEMTGCRSLEGLSIPNYRPSYCCNHSLSLARIFPRKLPSGRNEQQGAFLWRFEEDF